MEEAFIKKILPHSAEAEQAVIGSMLMDREAVVAASELLQDEDFYQYQYAVLFHAIVELFSEGQAVDLVTLQNKLKEKEVPPEICSLAFISDLVGAVPTSANIRHYAAIVSEKSLLRRMIKITEGITNICYLDKEKIDVIMEQSEKQIFDLLQTRNKGEFESIRDIVIRSLDNIEQAAKNKGSITGLSTGFYDLDYKTAGLQPSDLILIAARPSMGKTAFALNIIEHAVLRSKVTSVLFSLEMSKVQLVNRLLSMNSRVDTQKIRTGSIEENDWVELMESARAIGNSNLIIDDTAELLFQNCDPNAENLNSRISLD